MSHYPLLKIAEEAQFQVPLLPRLHFKGLCDVFIKINENHLPLSLRSSWSLEGKRVLCSLISGWDELGTPHSQPSGGLHRGP